MFREIALLAENSDNARVRQQFVTLDCYAFPFVECGPIASEKTEDIIAESRNFILAL